MVPLQEKEMDTLEKIQKYISNAYSPGLLEDYMSYFSCHQDNFSPLHCKFLKDKELNICICTKLPSKICLKLDYNLSIIISQKNVEKYCSGLNYKVKRIEL